MFLILFILTLSPPRPPITLSPALPAVKADEPKPIKQNFIITDDTDVKLDGSPCKFAEVPGTASVVTLEVAKDKTTILKIYFKSKGKP